MLGVSDYRTLGAKHGISIVVKSLDQAEGESYTQTEGEDGEQLRVGVVIL